MNAIQEARLYIEVKLCRGCTHYFHQGYDERCGHPSNKSTDLVSGQTIYAYTPRQMRYQQLECGKGGKLWECAQ